VLGAQHALADRQQLLEDRDRVTRAPRILVARAAKASSRAPRGCPQASLCKRWRISATPATSEDQAMDRDDATGTK